MIIAGLLGRIRVPPDAAELADEIGLAGVRLGELTVLTAIPERVA